jgi:predicted ester cyclase
MSIEENKGVIRRFVEDVQNGGTIGAIANYCSPDFVNHSAPPGVPTGCEGVELVTAMFRAAFPDGRMTIEDMVAEGDKVVTRKTFRGTHRGELMGIAPTGKRVSIGLIDILRLERGKVVEHWSVVDNLGMLQQLGVVPPSG